MTWLYRGVGCPRRLAWTVGAALLVVTTIFSLQPSLVGPLSERIAGLRAPTASSRRSEKAGGQGDVGWVLRERRAAYEEVCRATQSGQSQDFRGNVRHPYIYLPANISYCGVPKVGVTFWKRVFFFLHNVTGPGGQAVRSPLDVERLFVHRHLGGWATADTATPRGRTQLAATTRFMFARDPWSRLWSAYVDKFVLPDSWLDKGVKLLQMRDELGGGDGRLRVRSPLEQQVRDGGNWPLVLPNTTVINTQMCADNVTFAEFLHFIVHVDHNPHWKPVHQVCDPCAFRPHYLGKMETFSRDSAYILNNAGLGHLLGQQSHKSHVDDELQLLTSYHFKLWHQRQTLQGCIDALGLARRLWQAFQLNGYIPVQRPFPAARMAPKLRAATLEEAQSRFMVEVKAAHSARPLSHDEWSALKRNVLVQAFRSVPSDLLDAVQDEFRMDFLLFRYDARPADIFGD